nr:MULTISPECIES: peptide-methionine (S)-S-oxide reductase MsrA [unclassified Schaalia]
MGGGCFWGLQRLFQLVRGVQDTEVGYANGPISADGKPWSTPVSYRDVCSDSGHVEVVRITFDEDEMPLRPLLDLFFDTIDPLAVNKQGNDYGVQYRTGIYWEDSADLPIIAEAVRACEEKLGVSVATEVQQLRDFWPAEEDHQDYLMKNPRGYCHIGPVAFARAQSL